MLVRRSDMSLILTVWFLVRPSFAMQHLTSALRLCLCNILVFLLDFWLTQATLAIHLGHSINPYQSHSRPLPEGSFEVWPGAQLLSVWGVSLNIEPFMNS